MSWSVDVCVTARGPLRGLRAILLCLAAAVLIGASARAETLDVKIAPARSRLVNREDLPRYCGGLTQIEACTVLRGARLTCNCARDDRGWRLGGWAQFIPYVYLTEGRLIDHENAHLEDLRMQVGTWFADLSVKPFASEQECLETAGSESAAFPRRMELFRARSNERLH
jgi:hypothetical protein